MSSTLIAGDKDAILVDTLVTFGEVTTSFVLAAYASKPLTRKRDKD